MGLQGRYANAFSSIVYNVHLLGDYTTSDVKKLQEFNSVIHSLEKAIVALDPYKSKIFIREFRLEINKYPGESDSNKAVLALNFLKKELPVFIIQASGFNKDNGFKKHFSNIGYQLKN